MADDRIPLMLIHRAWSDWAEVAAAIDNWLAGVLDAPAVASESVSV